MSFNPVQTLLILMLVACSGNEKTEKNTTTVTAKPSEKAPIPTETNIDSDGSQTETDANKSDNQVDEKKTQNNEKDPSSKTTKKKRPPLNIPAPSNVSSPPEDATSSETGLKFITITPSKNKKTPSDKDWVEVHFTGWTSAGEAFISTLPSKRSRTNRLGSFPKGLQEGIKGMTPGEKKRFWIPQKLAPKGQLAKQSDVVYDVELVSIKQEPQAPKNLTPPKNAKKTKSGLAYKVMRKSKSRKAKRPNESSIVSVNIAQWNANGRLIMSTNLQGRPMNFMMNHKKFPPPLWREAAQLLKKGEIGRFWIPVENTSRNRKMGNTIMDMELLSITERPKRPQIKSIPPKKP